MAEVARILRILDLEDDPIDTDLVQANLAEGGIPCEITRVETHEEFVASLENGSFDLILSDYSLPSFDRLSALKLAKAIRPEVPFILVSGAIGEAIVGTIVHLAHTLGMQVVAEGVENERQAARLRDLGCDLGQGYHFSEPLPQEAVPGFLVERKAPASERSNGGAHKYGD